MSGNIDGGALSMAQLIQGISEGLCICSEINEFPFIKFTVWNDKLKDMTGYTMEEINRKGFIQTLYEGSVTQPKALQWVERMRLGEQMAGEEWEIRAKNGEHKIISVSTSVIRIDSGVIHILALIKDITRQREIERELKEIEERYSRLFEFSPDAVFVHDGSEIKFANSAGAKLLGFVNAGELSGLPLIQFVHEDYHDIILKRIEEVNVEQKYTGIIEEKFIRKDGSIVDVEAASAPLPYKGKIFSLVFVRDISRRKKMQNELIENEALLRQVTENILDMIVMVDIKGRVKYITPSHKKIIGFSREFLVGRYAFEVVHPEDRHYAESVFFDSLEKHWEGKVECRCRKEDGSYIWVEVAGKPLYDIHGEVDGALLSARDITERVRAEAAIKRNEKSLRESEERYRNFIELLPYAVYVINASNQLLYSNKMGLDYLEVSELEEVTGKFMWQLLIPHPDFEKDFIEGRNMELLIEQGYLPLREEKMVRLKDNKVMNLETVATKVPFNGEDAVFVVTRDISERKRAEELQGKMEEKTRLLNEVFEYEKLRTEFFANISHELRTPINVILSTLQLFNLRLGIVNLDDGIEKFRRHIGVMKQNCYRLIRLINNLIDVTKIDSGYLNLNLCNYNIVNVVEEITLSVAEYIENKGISLIFDTETEEKIIACDPDKIERIILNIISNAVKFTEPGGNIFVSMTEGEGKIIISVKDTGIGIPEEKQKYIFERFIQVDKSLTRTREGSGIGLSLVKSLVDMHGGKISVTSKYGEGTEFLIELPDTIIDNSEAFINNSDYNIQGNIEKINVEFSDIYF